jgi:hypothetical protein
MAHLADKERALEKLDRLIALGLHAKRGLGELRHLKVQRHGLAGSGCAVSWNIDPSL